MSSSAFDGKSSFTYNRGEHKDVEGTKRRKAKASLEVISYMCI